MSAPRADGSSGQRPGWLLSTLASRDPARSRGSAQASGGQREAAPPCSRGTSSVDPKAKSPGCEPLARPSAPPQVPRGRPSDKRTPAPRVFLARPRGLGCGRWGAGMGWGRRGEGLGPRRQRGLTGSPLRALVTGARASPRGHLPGASHQGVPLTPRASPEGISPRASTQGVPLTPRGSRAPAGRDPP